MIRSRCWAQRSRPRLARLEDEVGTELDDAVEFARASPFPDPRDAFADVYA